MMMACKGMHCTHYTRSGKHLMAKTTSYPWQMRGMIIGLLLVWWEQISGHGKWQNKLKEMNTGISVCYDQPEKNTISYGL